jgi:hypothetical protein
MIQLIRRTMACAERGFYKSLSTIAEKSGFVPQESIDGIGSSAEIGFVSQETTETGPGVPFLQSPERSDGCSQPPKMGSFRKMPPNR